MHSSFGAFIALAVTSAAGTQARTFTVVNNCAYTIWPAMFTDLNVAPNVPDQPTGWEAPAGSQVSFTVPDDWKSGRIWGRLDCDFTGANANLPGSCVTGGCNGGLLCDPHTGTGVPPATVAEWTLEAGGDVDYYDVSLVDGFNIPMAVTNNKGCNIASCPVDLTPSCPSPLIGPKNSAGVADGCMTACDANLSGDASNSPNCCSGSFNTPATCPPTGIQYYSFFKGNCPDAYAYAYDESSGTALWTCDSSLLADYTLTFCPSGTDSKTGSSTTSSSSSTVSSSSSTVSSTTSTVASTTSTVSSSSSTSASSTSTSSSSSSTGSSSSSSSSTGSGDGSSSSGLGDGSSSSGLGDGSSSSGFGSGSSSSGFGSGSSSSGFGDGSSSSGLGDGSSSSGWGFGDGSSSSGWGFGSGSSSSGWGFGSGSSWGFGSGSSWGFGSGSSSSGYGSGSSGPSLSRFWRF